MNGLQLNFVVKIKKKKIKKNERAICLFTHGYKSVCFLVLLVWFGLVFTLELSACMQPPELTKIPDSGLPSTPCSFCLEIRSRTDLAPPTKLSFGTLGQRQRKINLNNHFFPTLLVMSDLSK